MDKKILLHHLRNPYSIDEIEMRKVRLETADELERLWEKEKRFDEFLNKLQNIKKITEGI